MWLLRYHISPWKLVLGFKTLNGSKQSRSPRLETRGGVPLGKGIVSRLVKGSSFCPPLTNL